MIAMMLPEIIGNILSKIAEDGIDEASHPIEYAINSII
jgi:hypothetical protein